MMPAAAVSPVGADAHTCPQRAGAQGPSGKDRWVTTRWRHWSDVVVTRPRSCSFCGCLHPNDAIALILSGGWFIEVTSTEPQRRVLHTQAFMEGTEEDMSPLVVLYTWHMDQLQIDLFNAVIRADHIPVT